MGLDELALATTCTGDATVAPFDGELMVTPAYDTPAREIVIVKKRTSLLRRPSRRKA
jgi:hypothetical protein